MLLRSPPNVHPPLSPPLDGRYRRRSARGRALQRQQRRGRAVEAAEDAFDLRHDDRVLLVDRVGAAAVHTRQAGAGRTGE